MRGEEGSMGLTRHHRPLGSLLAVALVLGASFLPAAAQSGSEAVVCVGSERRTLATNPIRRVYTEDMEIVYRIGVDIGQRAQIERTLSSELGSYLEVWCACSDPGDDHAVIISYTGVIRQDLTVDPEDPRFQAFSVGFGTDFDAAEQRGQLVGATAMLEALVYWNAPPPGAWVTLRKSDKGTHVRANGTRDRQNTQFRLGERG